MTRSCSIPGCDQPYRARGWCNKHWQHWYFHGDPLRTKNTEWGAGERFYRDVVLVHDGEDCLIWAYGRNSGGYGKMNVNGIRQYVHRRICEEVNGPPPTPKHQAAHSCGKGHLGCVAKKHIRWATRSENEADKIIHGTARRRPAHV